MSLSNTQLGPQHALDALARVVAEVTYKDAWRVWLENKERPTEHTPGQDDSRRTLDGRAADIVVSPDLGTLGIRPAVTRRAPRSDGVLRRRRSQAVLSVARSGPRSLCDRAQMRGDHMEGPSEADWERYWEIGSDLSFERGLRACGYKTIEGPQDKIGKSVAVASDPLVELFRDLYGDQVVAAGLSLLRRLRGDTWRTQDGNETHCRRDDSLARPEHRALARAPGPHHPHRSAARGNVRCCRSRWRRLDSG